jgi:hypothetical protein
MFRKLLYNSISFRVFVSNYCKKLRGTPNNWHCDITAQRNIKNISESQRTLNSQIMLQFNQSAHLK